MIDTRDLRDKVMEFGTCVICSEELIELINRLEAAEKERDWNAERLEDAIEEWTALRAELETERMRLTACGVVAMSNTTDSAKQARDMSQEYWSASCVEVARMVDENIKLRAKIEAMERQKPVKIQHRVPFLDSNGECVGYTTWKDGRGFNHWPHRSLYLAPGAQAAQSIRPAALSPVINWLRNGCDPMKAADELEMLAAAPEAKP